MMYVCYARANDDNDEIGFLANVSNGVTLHSARSHIRTHRQHMANHFHPVFHIHFHNGTVSSVVVFPFSPCSILYLLKLIVCLHNAQYNDEWHFLLLLRLVPDTEIFWLIIIDRFTTFPKISIYFHRFWHSRHHQIAGNKLEMLYSGLAPNVQCTHCLLINRIHFRKYVTTNAHELHSLRKSEKSSNDEKQKWKL